jgi:formylmethanofuran:tetrahydromethanopterin formyltransferase
MMECLFGIGVRLLVTFPDKMLREEAVYRFTGGTSLLTGQYELGIDQRLNRDQTPDNRYGAILHIWVPWAEANTPFKGKPYTTPPEYLEMILNKTDFKSLGSETHWKEKKMILFSSLKKRLRDALLPIPSVSIYSAAKRKSEETLLDLGPFSRDLSLAPIEEENQFDDTDKNNNMEKNDKAEKRKKSNIGKSYNVLLLGGLIKIEDQFIELGICGAAFFLSADTLEIGLQAGRDAIGIIESIPEVCHIFDVCGSGVVPNIITRKQQDKYKTSIPEQADSLTLKRESPTLEIIMNSFSYQRLAECIKKIQDSIKRYQSNIYLRPAWYDWQWGNIAINVERWNNREESHSKLI